MVNFTVIDMAQWERREYYQHYFSAVPCTYSMTVKLDITPIIHRGRKLYPSMLHLIATLVNRHEEFRTAINARGELGIYDSMLPCYTVFHKETQTFSNLWTPYFEKYEDFYRSYREDLDNYGHKSGLMGKPDVPENHFPVSMIPWTTFEGFNLNLQKGYEYLLPIFTMGKYERQNGQIQLPLAIQVHHAVCDGFHLCRFVEELQQQIHALRKD